LIELRPKRGCRCGASVQTASREPPHSPSQAKTAEKRLLEALAKNVEERLVSDFPALRSNQSVSFEQFKTVIAQNPSWLENEPREELAGLTKSIIRSTEASVRNEMADEFARVDAALARKNLKNWKTLPMPDADAIARAQRAATTDLADGMIDSDDETTLCAEPMQWRLGRAAQPDPADMVKFLNVAVPLIYTMNHTGVALASQTLGCTAVPDEFMGYCALQRPLLIRAAPQSLPLHKNLPCLLVSYSH